ncbi:hypothetical protein BJ742DRAFT_681230 [Cladochytrium replicatum]|nr:hypothetical protein BJ742DRAFT_681230 [Cladochytrium replicatum]
MNIGERARFLVSPEHTTGYLDLATALRKQESSPPGHAQVFSGCCGGRAMLEAQNDANADLNLVANMCAPLEFEFELIEVQEPGSFEKEGWEMSVEEKWEEANRAKEAGVVLYNEGKFGEASDKFGKALGLLESVGMSSQVQELKHQKNEQSRMDELERHSRWLKRIKSRDDDNPKLLNLDKLETLLRTTRLNYVACKLKLEDYAAAITQASEILKDDPDNLKALFRRGQAYTRMGRDLDLAGQDLDRCKDILSSSGDVATLNEVKREIQLVKQKLSKHEKVEKQIFARMFV